MLRRRFVLAAAPALIAGGSLAAALAPPVVTLLGDSITAGLGLPAADALPAQLQAALGRRGVRASVRGAGVSGDTTAGALARLDFSVQADTAVCVVALGGNDFLQSIAPAAVRRNLTAIVRRLKARRIAVVLGASRAPAKSSGAYGRELDAAFAGVARQEGVPLAPDLLAGTDRAALRQGDGMHPNAAGARIIAEKLAPGVASALKAALIGASRGPRVR